MFGYARQVVEDDDTDNSSCPSTYKHFNAAVKPRSKLGRRRIVSHKDDKPQENDAFNTGEQHQTPWQQKDDSGICTSGSTPSLTHPVARTGTLFNSQSKFDGNSYISGFTPSFKTGRENKFAFPVTPMRSLKSEPLKEINGMNGVSNSNPIVSSSSIHEPCNERSGDSVQKQLNLSFICDESSPAESNVTNNQSAPTKTSNESTFSDDSSFMTCHELQRAEVQTNKTLYDPEFLKTPGKNLAEIRIDESPFNPLEGFLEETDDFRGYDSRTPMNNVQGKPGKSLFSNEVESLNPGSTTRDHSQNDQMSFPPAETDVPNKQELLFSNSSMNNNKSINQDFHNQNLISQCYDSGFKHPGNGLGPPQKFMEKADVNLNSSDVGNVRSMEEKNMSGVNVNRSIDETTNVTYPQRGHPQKNSFTSQFSLNPRNGMKGGLQEGKALSLSSAIGRPLSAASCSSNRGVISALGTANQLDKPGIKSAALVDDRVSTMNSHIGVGNEGDRKGSFGVSGTTGHPSNSVFCTPAVPPCSNGPSSLNLANEQLDTSITWIPCVKPPSSQSNHRTPGRFTHSSTVEDSQKNSESACTDADTGTVDEVTVMAKGHSRPTPPPTEPPAKIPPKVNTTRAPQQTVKAPEATPQSGPSVMSALIKPQPQNVIVIKGTPYTVLSLLGKGGSSQVYQALGPQSSKLMAIKCVNLASVEENMATDYLNEIALLSKLQGCPSVIKMIEHEYVRESQMLYVVLEKGDIDFSKLIKNISETKQISMAMITYYWTEMLNAVNEIHKRGIIHSDLKPANFLLVEGRLKLIDFGIASSLQGEDTTSVMKEVPAGTYNYMSPEAISGRKINRKSDVWSMGCILFNLLYGRTPFSHINNRWQKLHAIADPEHKVVFPKLQHSTPPSLRLALRWCLMKDSSSRPTVEELVKLSELAPHGDSNLGKEIDSMMCKYFRKVLPNLKVLSEEEEFV